MKFDFFLKKIGQYVVVLCCGVFANNAMAQTGNTKIIADTTATIDSSFLFFFNNKTKSNLASGKMFNLQNRIKNADSNLINLIPHISIQQMVKGNLSGVYVRESSGEPGVDQNLFIQGINGPLMSKKDLFEQQAVVYLNGIPLMRDHPFAYEIQKNDYLRIGTNTNNLANFNINNIESIEVIKDPARLAALGPLAANGAIWVTSKNATSGKTSGSINIYSGYAPAPRVSPTNSAYEFAFRKPYYDRYANVEDLINMPAYLKDSTNTDYYGPANWYKSYYKPTFTYGADAALTGGSSRANFRLFLSSLKDANAADKTGLERHNASFYINIAPMEWLNFSSMISYNRLDRDRNKNITDRLVEQRYLPDLANPLTPNNNLYNKYLREFDKAVDMNVNHSLQSYFNLSAKFKTLVFNSSLMLDYSDINRDVFWPKTLLEKNNFVSHYLGINQRVNFTNYLTNTFAIGHNQSLKITAKQNYTNDMYRYKYAIGYNGPNDFVKVNLFHNNTSGQNYISYYFPNSLRTALMSLSGEAEYEISNLLKINAVVRRDGSSTKDVNNRWFTGYSAGFDYNAGKQLALENMDLNLYGGYAKLGKVNVDDRFSTNSIYSSYVGWKNEPILGTFIGIPALARPYNYGWVNANMPWAYFEKINIGARWGLFNSKVQFGIDVYNRNDKNGTILVPTPAEWGYEGQYKSGLTVNNSGIDLSVYAKIIDNEAQKIQWSVNGNLSYNNNKLKALPNGLDEIIISGTKLKVGERIDAYWVYKNEGKFNSDAEVPTNPITGRKLTYNGVAFRSGDAKWADLNGDFDVNDEDRILIGNFMPKNYGGFGTDVTYQRFSINAQFYFALKQSFLNQAAASRLDFVNGDFSKSLNSVKEITSWQKGEDLSAYPMYNPWSSVVPYQLSQDLFVQDVNYVKLRSVSLSYRVPKSEKNARMMQIYLTGNNLFTFSKFKGSDPELLNYQGVYDGKALPLQKTVTLGVKIDF